MVKANRVALLPLPLAAPPGLAAGCPRATELASAAARSVDELFCGSSADASGPSPSFAQYLSLSGIFDAASRMASSYVDRTPRECFGSLAGGLDYHQESCSCVPMDLELLSFPSNAEPKRLSTLLGPVGEQQVHSFISSCVLPIQDVADVKSASRLVSPYMDPSLRKSARAYHNLLRKLQRAGIVDFAFSS